MEDILLKLTHEQYYRWLAVADAPWSTAQHIVDFISDIDLMLGLRCEQLWKAGVQYGIQVDVTPT